MNCKRPDRHEPSLECGYPLPCPHHTLIIDASHARTTSVTIPIASGAVATSYQRFLDVGDAVGPQPKKKKKKRRTR